jgi:hypothetical protein
VALAVTMGALVAGCGPDKTDGGTLTGYAMDKVGSNRALGFLNNVGDCASDANTTC